MFKVRVLIALVMLLICSVQDIRTGYINITVVGLATGLYLCVYVLYELCMNMASNNGSMNFAILNESSLKLHITDIILGVFFILLSKVAKGIGEGDFYVLAALCLICGSKDIPGIMFTSSLFAGIYAIFLKLVKKLDLSEGFPYVPFITSGLVTQYLITRLYSISV